MKFDKKSWYALGVAILGIILYFTIVKTIGIILLIIGLVGFALLSTKFGKKIIREKSEKFEEKPMETEIEESEEGTEKENIQ